MIGKILEAFRTAVEFRLVRWLNAHMTYLPLTELSLAMFGFRKF